MGHTRDTVKESLVCFVLCCAVDLLCRGADRGGGRSMKWSENIDMRAQSQDLMKGRADGTKRCNSLSVQKLSEKSSEALWPPEPQLPGRRRAGRGCTQVQHAVCRHPSSPFSLTLPSPSPKANEHSGSHEEKSFCLYETKSQKLLTMA